ncbi:2829_t:CDS:10, partial [Dentiscutata erythropus]
VIAKGVEVPELDPCSKCNKELFLYEIKKPFTILTCAHIFHRSCLEDYVKDLPQCPKCGIEVEPIDYSESSSILVPMQISPQMRSSQSENTVTSDTIHSLNLLPFPDNTKQSQKRPSEDTTKNKLSSKKSKQNKEKGDKKDSNIIKKLITELKSNTSEQNKITSYQVIATEDDPQPIDFLNLYTKITSAESESQKQSQKVIFQYYNFGMAIAKRFKFHYEKSYNVNDANSDVNKEIEKQLPDGTDKIGRVESFSALTIAKLTVDQINYVISQIPDKPPTESIEKCILVAQILLNEEPIIEYRPSFLNGLELDAFFQKHQIALEIQGAQYRLHNTSWYKDVKKLEDIVNRDRLKICICQDNGIFLLEVCTVLFGQWAESSKGGEGWMLRNGERVRDVLVRMTSKTIDQAKELQSEGEKLDASTLSTIRLGLSSIVDLSSEFSGGMCTWFGEEWSELKAKALMQINITPKKFGDAIESDINKIEELCNEYKYWEARDFVYEKLKGRPDKTRILQRQEGNKQNLTEIEFVLKVAGPIIDIIFSDVQHLVHLKWGETVSKATAVGRKIDLQVICRGKNQGKIVELSHSECARRTTPTKIISDRSKCLRTNKSLAALYGQIIGVDLLDNGLYFGFEGPLLRFPTQINDITVLKQTLEALYFFKESIVHKAEALLCLNKDSDPFSNIFHTEIISKPHHCKADFTSPTYFTPQKDKRNEIRLLSSNHHI